MKSARRATAKPRAAKRQRPAQARAGRIATDTTSLRHTAYETIKHEIITCALAPGEYVNEAGLCARLGLGRTPVHQALQRLMLEGLVEIMPRKGAIVKPVSLDEVMQIIEMRLLNEVYCARLVAERADEESVKELEEILARARQWTRVHNVEQMMLCDRDFHDVLTRIAGNVVLSDLLRRLHDRSLRLWFISLKAGDHHESVQSQHESILTAIRKHDPERAEAAMRAHIESFRDNLTRSV
jgi:DNA-binding GntR family transcriptional regulator